MRSMNKLMILLMLFCALPSLVGADAVTVDSTNTSTSKILKVTNTTDSSNKDTGALQVDGGVGVEKDLNVGQDMTISGTTVSSDKDTGALVVEGGAGIEEDLNVGGDASISGGLDVTGTVSTGNPVAHASIDATQNIANNTYHTIDFDDVAFDTGCDITTGSGWKYTCDTSGIYQVSACAQVGNNGEWDYNEHFTIYVAVNGTKVRAFHNTYGQLSNANGRYTSSGCTLLDLSIDDEISIIGYQNSGASNGFVSNSGSLETCFVDIRLVNK